jgi:tetratricopeptide (TPR) repeat protein
MENNWREVELVVGELLELPEGEARTRLERSGLTPEVRRRAEQLLRACRDSEGFLEDPPILLGAPPGPDRRLGERLGSWRLSSVIGSGGMGTVYRAAREDGDFEQQAAVKVIAAGRLSRSSERRFREERQILARLEHPSVARLIDGGVSPDGSPYLVMEYVEGTPIDAWAQGVALRERLRMFRQVCEAVHFAHQNLVVHCDLKPANIMVTREGMPKLLDFGIARFLEGNREETGSLLHIMTPDYASPEQVRGLRPGTSSDVYSLGVLLYELATGRRPYRLAGKGLDEVLATICETKVEKPRSGAADLDAIVLKALQKEPQRRYGSVEKLAADVECYLENRPVSARPDTFFYRARKTVARHLTATIAATAALTLIVGLGITAEIQRVRAEGRFQQVRSLARSVIFEVYDRIAPLNGSTDARKLLASRAVEYLDSLANQSGNDPTLLLELSSSYRRIATVLGDDTQPNLGDVPGAMRNIDAAIAVARRAAAARPRDLDAPRELVRALTVKSHLLLMLSRRAELTGIAAEKAAMVRKIVASPDANIQDQIEYAGQLFDEASDIPDPANRIGPFQDLVKRYEALSASRPNDPQQRRNVALMEKYLGSFLSRTGRADESLDHKRHALEIDSNLVENYPDNRQYLIDLHNDLRIVCGSLERLGRFEEALSYIRRAESLSRKLVAADPNDLSGPLAFANDREVSCEVLMNLDRLVEARATCEDALQLSKSIPGNNANASYIKGLTFEVLAGIAQIQKRPEEVCVWYRRAAAVFPDTEQSLSNSDFSQESAKWKLAAAKACTGH